MEWLARMNTAMNYIEDHLDQTIEFDIVAQMACCSTYHFQRMFSFIVDMPLSEYIRRRRMTLAAFELQNSNIKVIDLALKYTYDSPISFARAFQNMHGVTPSVARDKGVALKAYPRISFHISIKGDVAMNYRIEEAPAFVLFGKSIEIPYDEAQQYETIKKFVEQSVGNGVVQSIWDAIGQGPFETLGKALPGDDERKIIGICASCEAKAKDKFRFMLAAERPEQGVAASFELLAVPKATWVIFSLTSPQFMEQETVTAIWKRLPEWFQASGYKHRDHVPEIEKRFQTKNGYLAEVWIPVEKE
jgi:AraC-type DNA-binding domain-containing proteins